MRLLEWARGALRRRLDRGRVARARRLEALGQLAEATAEYVEAGARDDAARLLVLRADTAPAPLERARLLARAAELSEPKIGSALRRRRARLLLELARDGTVVLSRSEVRELGVELEALGDPTSAASAFEFAGDAEGQTRALIQAGAVERLEQVLEAERAQARSQEEHRQAVARVQSLIDSGLRRQALELARELLRSGGNADTRLEGRVRELENRRADGPRVRVELDGVLLELVLGDSVVVGRADAQLTVVAPALSRSHLEVRRGGNDVEVVDLHSRNGTLLAGARISAPVRVGERLSLLLGGEIPLTLEPWGGTGVQLELAGRTIFAPLGPLCVGCWRLYQATDGWVEADLGRTPVDLSGCRVAGTVQLLHGDCLGERRDEPKLRVL